MTGFAQAAPPTVWAAPSLQRVRPTDAAQSTTALTIYAAKGETESFQLVVKAPSGNGLTNVNATAPSLGGAQVTFYREHYFYLASGSGDWATNLNKPQGSGYYPDALVPFKDPTTGAAVTGGAVVGAPFTVAAGQNQPVWVDVYVPPSTPAGQYTGAFTVTAAEGSAAVTVTLKVWNFSLPLKPALKSCFMYWATSDGGMGRGLLQPDQELLKNRLNPVSTTASYERQFIDTVGMQSTSMPFWSSADQTTGTMNPAPSVSSIQTAKSQHQSDLYDYCYSADEISNPALYPGIKSWGRNLHSAGVDQLITMVPVPDLYDDGSGTGRSAVDDWVILPKQYDAATANVKYVQTKGDKVWSYNCTQQDDYSPKWLLDYSPLNYRLQPGFINQSLGLVGLLYWRVDWWTVDPWTGAYPWPSYPGEGLLVYPGAKAGLTGQVVPSIRLKYLRDGVDDYDYVQLLKQQGYGDWALGVARTVGPDWKNWTRDPNAVEAARVQLGNKLDSLGGGSHAVSVTVAASPSTVASGGAAALSAAATDSAGHSITAWAWSDGGAGGSFSSTTAQKPSYTAAPNSTGANRVVSLNCTATCSTGAGGVGSGTLNVQSTTTHTLSLNAYASPGTVASSGTTALTAAASDSQGDSVTAWSWSDGGAGGRFSSTAAQNPNYTAPANTSGASRTLSLTVTATCSGAAPITKSAVASLVVNSTTTTSGHTVTVVASANKTAIASGGSVNLSMKATDSQGHSGFAYQWSDNGAGGTFSSTTAQKPTYTAAPNTTSSPRTITLTAGATCKWQYPWVTGSSTLTLTEDPASLPPAHAVTVTASASPSAVASGGTAALTATATDSQGHTSFAWKWSDGGAGGAFSSATAQSPSYTAPANTSGSARTITLTVTATCSASGTAVTGSKSATLTVNGTATPAHVTVTAAATPSTVASGGTVTLSMTAKDLYGHTGFGYQWSDNGAGGTFSSATAQNPSYRAPSNTSGAPRTLTLTATAICKWQYPWAQGSAPVSLTVNSQ